MSFANQRISSADADTLVQSGGKLVMSSSASVLGLTLVNVVLGEEPELGEELKPMVVAGIPIAMKVATRGAVEGQSSEGEKDLLRPR